MIDSIFLVKDERIYFLCLMNIRKKRESYRKGEEGYYHLCTDGWKDGLIFHNAAQFAYGLIVLGLLCLRFNLTIYAFALMPNHIHLILKGTGAVCLDAFDYLKHKLSVRLKQDGHPPLPEDYWFKLVKIEDEEQLKREIIYVLRNPLEKGQYTVGGYLWASGWLYFSNLAKAMGGTLAGEMSKRSKIKYFTTEQTIPDHWRVHPYLGLLPDSFVDTTLVERLFPSPKDLQTALVKDYELYFQIARRLGELYEFSKTEIAGIVNQTLQKRFGGRNLMDLTEQDKGKMAIILNREYGLTSYQISRSIFLKELVVRQFLSSKELR